MRWVILVLPSKNAFWHGMSFGVWYGFNYSQNKLFVTSFRTVHSISGTSIVISDSSSQRLSQLTS